ncbi:hypothetical protein [Acinetobacter sp. YH12147]|uniref:hypothetical protein n=1 Tax=Acinetobacter sp. YH12147 TaxID=2601130 RepID=UPI0015D1F644|nr:hypothetical protein [Acinetobacter sp. YH12147]
MAWSLPPEVVVLMLVVLPLFCPIAISSETIAFLNQKKGNGAESAIAKKENY